ncbi:imidazole glycerol phosphate synthase subunit HisH [Candidatus Giovannonibacteria bacterium]|nr:imidazole glycerol phosphate synthase subunit HisH [Candidatus Giovannonibacteria bacterium]
MNSKKICILDYGSGNVRSVFNILFALGKDVIVSNRPEDILAGSHIILPGVGAFGTSMEKIKKTIHLDILENEIIRNKKPFLGICVGMQVLADRGFEFGEHVGLGWIHGEVKKMSTGGLPLPHIGWNNVSIAKQTPLLNGLSVDQDFYFVHSYVFKEENNENVIAKTEYGEQFNSIISKDNIFGVQFHPEKSQKAGKLLLENFLSLR